MSEGGEMRGEARVSTRELPFLGAVLGLAALVPLIYAFATGFVRRPFIDDWAYLRIARRYIESGVIETVGWNDLSLLSQLFVSKAMAPLTGVGVAGLRTQSLLFGAGLLILVGISARRWSTSSSWAAAVATTAVMPALALYAPSYMADVPFAFFVVLGTVAGMVAAEHAPNSTAALAWRAAGVAGTCVAFNYRQAGGVVLVGLAFGVPWGRLAPRRRLVTAGIFGLGLVVMTFAQVANPLHEETGTVSFSQPVVGLGWVLVGLFSTSIFLWPFVLGLRSVAVGRASRRAALVLAALTGLGGLWLWDRMGWVVVGDTIRADGGNPGTDYAPPFSVLSVVTVTLCAAAIALGALLAYRVGAAALADGLGPSAVGRRIFSGVRSLNPPQRVAAAVASLSLLFVLGSGFGLIRPLDRYLLPIVALTPLAVPRSAVRRPVRLRGRTAVLMVGAAAIGVLFVTDTMSFTVSRWKAADELVARGVRPQEIEAGLDYVGYHYGGVARPANQFDGDWRAMQRYVFPGFEPCVEVTPERREDEVPLAQRSFWRVPGVLRGTMYSYGAPGGVCSLLTRGNG